VVERLAAVLAVTKTGAQVLPEQALLAVPVVAETTKDRRTLWQ
jgi:hypothetical protein